MAHLLIVDDEQSICWGLRKLAQGLGHTVAVAGSAEQGFAAARRQAPDAILLDVRLPGMDGLSAMDRFREELGRVPVIVMTAYGELSTAIEAVRRGAFEYLVKPFDLTVAQRAIQRALAHAEPPSGPAAEARAASPAGQIVGCSPAIQEVFKRIAVVADIPLSIQVKLLRVLEYGEMVPVGGDRPIRSDFRIISATHQNLGQRVADGQFRADLYYRLITFEIEIPPLRHRGGDIPLLTEYFLDVLARRNGCLRPAISPAAMRALEAHPWHGNVRELRNALEHAILLARGSTIAPEHLPPPTPPGNDPGQTREAMLAAMVRDWARHQLEQSPRAANLYERLLMIVEPPLLETVLERSGGQFLAAARDLGLHRVTLKRKVNEYRERSMLERPPSRSSHISIERPAGYGRKPATRKSVD